MKEVINYKGVCRTAPATPGLLIRVTSFLKVYRFSKVSGGCLFPLFNRPGVAGAVLQTPP